MPKEIPFPTFLPNKGQASDKPEEFLNNQVSPYSRNMEFFNEDIKGRGGLSKFSTTALSGYVMEIPKLTLVNGTEFVLFATPKDIYTYDFVNSVFTILTPTYTTGTIEVQAGTPTILRGSGTSWIANAKIGDYVKLGAGAIHTGSTWYEVESVDSDTQITLTSAAATTAAGTAYVLRQIFSGGNTNYWDSEEFLDTNLGKVIVFTNGVDMPVYWDGSGQVIELTGTPTGFTAAKYVSSYGGRLIFLWCVVGSNEPTTEYFSDVANIVSWDDSNFRQFNEDNTDPIGGSIVFNGYHVVIKENNAYIGRFVGGSTIFDYDENSECHGTKAAKSIVKDKDFIYYYGSDRKFHRWNLLQDDIITEGLFPETKEFDPNNEAYIKGAVIKPKNQIRWFCPYNDIEKNNYVAVYDNIQRIPLVWVYTEADALCSLGSYVRNEDVYADDAIYGEQYADETSGFADDAEFLDASRILVYGGYDGIVRIADSGSTDDGTAFTRLLRFKRFNFDDPHNRKRLKEQSWWLKADTSGTVTIKMRLDDKTSYESETKTISLIADNVDQDIIKRYTTWNKHAHTFQPEISATNDFSLLGFINFVHKKGKKVR